MWNQCEGLPTWKPLIVFLESIMAFAVSQHITPCVGRYFIAQVTQIRFWSHWRCDVCVNKTSFQYFDHFPIHTFHLGTLYNTYQYLRDDWSPFYFSYYRFRGCVSFSYYKAKSIYSTIFTIRTHTSVLWVHSLIYAPAVSVQFTPQYSQ